MFTSLKYKITRFILMAGLALMATGLPVVQIVHAAQCAGGGSCSG